MRAAKVDANQKEIVAALRKVGATVSSTATIGKGFPDLIVGFRGVNYLLEVKTGTKPPSERKLTPDQVLFHAKWTGQIAVVNNVNEALQAIGITN
jgi:Holliday junction resolvase